MSPRRARRGAALVAALGLVNLPGALALGDALAFRSSNRSTGFITVGGVDRGYVLHVPDGLDPSRPVPLVVSLHGGGLWGAAQRDISGWNAVADRGRFIVAYPSGGSRASARAWALRAGPRLEWDLEFLGLLLDTLTAAHPVDPARVYLDGLSNGAGLAFAAACTMPDRVAALGMVAALLLLPGDHCTDGPPVPLAVFHGTADPVTPYRGGRTWISPHLLPDVAGWVAGLAARGGCDAAPADPAPSSEVTRRAWTGCAGGADVLLYTIHGGGHSWPGGARVPEWLLGPTPRSVDATAELWEFFRTRGP